MVLPCAKEATDGQCWPGLLLFLLRAENAAFDSAEVRSASPLIEDCDVVWMPIDGSGGARWLAAFQLDRPHER